jgi:hypothetical protein
MFMIMDIPHIRLPSAMIIGITTELACITTEVAPTAANQGPQQIRMGRIISAGNLPIVGQFRRYQLILLDFNNSGNIGNRYPFC